MRYQGLRVPRQVEATIAGHEIVVAARREETSLVRIAVVVASVVRSARCAPFWVARCLGSGLHSLQRIVVVTLELSHATVDPLIQRIRRISQLASWTGSDCSQQKTSAT